MFRKTQNTKIFLDAEFFVYYRKEKMLFFWLYDII